MHCPRRTSSLLASSSLALLVLGCPDEVPPADPLPLAAPTGWVRVTDPAQDVFADERPQNATCDESGITVDPVAQSLEIHTGLCDYLTLRQATLEPLAPGDRVSIRVFHYELTALTPSQGYLGLAIAGERAWEARVPIPSQAGPLSGEITIERELPAGTELQLHVHNHGVNIWELLSVRVTPAG